MAQMAQPTGGKTKETFITLFYEKKSFFTLHLIYYENNPLLSTIKQFRILKNVILTVTLKTKRPGRERRRRY